MAQWVLVTTPVLVLALNCAAYLLLRRVLGARVATSIVSGLVFGLAAMIVTTFVYLSHVTVDPWELWISQIGTYLALSFCFWAFLNLNITSLRIRVLRDLLNADGNVAVSDLLASYSDEERLRRRLARLTNGGQIALIDGRWRLCSRALLSLARCIDAVRRIMGQSEGNTPLAHHAQPIHPASDKPRGSGAPMPASATSTPAETNPTTPKWRSPPPWFINVMKLALSALVIVLVAVNIDLRATWSQISGQSYWCILAAIAIIALQIVAGGLRWHAVLTRIGGSIAAVQAVNYFYISVFFNTCLAGSLGGDIVRAWLANRTEAGLAIVITSVIVDHVVAVAAIALLVLLTLPIFIDRVGYGSALVPGAVAVAGIAGIVLCTQLHRLPVAWRQHWLLRGLNGLASAMRDVFLRPSAAVVVLGWAVLAQTALALAAYVIARGLDMPVTLLDCVVLMQPVALATALPISIGGWGVREAAMVGLFGLIGLPSSSALALSVQLGLLSLVATLPGGLLFLLLRGRTPATRGGVTQSI